MASCAHINSAFPHFLALFVGISFMDGPPQSHWLNGKRCIAYFRNYEVHTMHGSDNLISLNRIRTQTKSKATNRMNAAPTVDLLTVQRVAERRWTWTCALKNRNRQNANDPFTQRSTGDRRCQTRSQARVNRGGEKQRNTQNRRTNK